MNERCKSCGAELFVGQQFCRQCGAPTRILSDEEMPTQMFRPHGEAPPAAPEPASGDGGTALPGGTTPLPGRGTDPGFQYYPGYQSPLASAHHATSPAVVPPSRARRTRYWLFAALLLVVFSAGASMLVAYLIRESTRGAGVRRVVVKPPPVPPITVDVPEISVPETPVIVGNAVEKSVLDETGAEVSDDETTIIKTYPVSTETAFSIQNFNGPVNIESWDAAEAEIKIIKRGGTPEGRERAKIGHTHTGKRLSFSTPLNPQADLEEIAYEVKLPRAALGEIQIKSLNSEVSLKGVRAGQISIGVQHGDVELQNVAGDVTTKTVQGDTTITFESEANPGGAQSFSTVNGDVMLRVSPGMNADLKAETISGDIEVTSDLGLKVEKRRVGRRAAGIVGAGGQPIAIKTISGDISIER